MNSLMLILEIFVAKKYILQHIHKINKNFVWYNVEIVSPGKIESTKMNLLKI